MDKCTHSWVVVGLVLLLAFVWINPVSGADKEAQKNGSFTGTLESIDSKTRALQVKSQSSHMSFQLDKEAKIETQSKKDASLKDLQVGDEIRVDYTVVKGVNMAQKIAAKKKEAERETEETKEPIKY